MSPPSFVGIIAKIHILIHTNASQFSFSLRYDFLFHSFYGAAILVYLVFNIVRAIARRICGIQKFSLSVRIQPGFENTHTQFYLFYNNLKPSHFLCSRFSCFYLVVVLFVCVSACACVNVSLVCVRIQCSRKHSEFVCIESYSLVGYCDWSSKGVFILNVMQTIQMHTHLSLFVSFFFSPFLRLLTLLFFRCIS